MVFGQRREVNGFGLLLWRNCTNLNSPKGRNPRAPFTPHLHETCLPYKDKPASLLTKIIKTSKRRSLKTRIMTTSTNSSLPLHSMAPAPAPASNSTLSAGGTGCIFDPEFNKKTSEWDADYIWKNDNKHYSDFFYETPRPRSMTIVAANDDTELLIVFLRMRSNRDYKRRLVLNELCEYDSVNCLTLLLDDDGEATGLIEMPPPIELMELACDHGAHRCVKLLLDHFGPDLANLRDSNNLLPLNHALVALIIPHNPDNYDPIISMRMALEALCDWENRNKLETVRTLAHLTKELGQELIKYAMEGSSEKVAALLLVAPEKVAALLLVAPEKVMPLCVQLRKQLAEEIALLHYHDVTSALLSSGTQFLTRKRLFLQRTLTWFEVFDKIGRRLFDYLCHPKDDWNSQDLRNILRDIWEGAGFFARNMIDFAFDLSYRYLPEHFEDYKKVCPIRARNHKMDVIPDGAINDVQGLLNLKVQGQLHESICAQDSNNLVSLVAYRMKRGYMIKNRGFSDLQLLRSICYHKSAECATMLLEGRSDVRIKVNSALEDGLYPLHLAATSLSPSLIDLFLLHGARTDVQCKDSRSPYYGMYPLELALKTLRLHRYVSDWMPTKSIFKLIYIFCLPEMIGPLQAIEKLACDASVVRKISCHFIQEGKLVELSALLMVSWDMLVSPGHNGDIGRSFIVKHILSELQMLANKESKLVNTGETDGLQQVGWKKGCLLFALSMLEILKRARTAIQDYRLSLKVKDVANFEVPLDVSNLLKDLGFCLKNEDIDAKDVTCLLRGLHSERLDVAISSEKDGAHPLKPDNREIYDDDVKGYEVCYPMCPESLWSLGGPSSRVFQIPNAIHSQHKLNRATSFPEPAQQPSGVIAIRHLPRYWPRQPSSSASFATKRSRTFILYAPRRWLRFSRI